MKKSILKGGFSGLFWGMDTTLISLVLCTSLLCKDLLAPIIVAFIHDFCSALWLIVLLIRKKRLKLLFSKMKTSEGRTLMLGGILGGPVGMAAYSTSISMIGTGYTAAISAAYPAIGTLFAILIIKDKPTKIGITGIFMAVAGAVVLSGFAVQGGAVSFMGILLALICAVAWGSESTVCALGMKKEIDPDIALSIRQITSSVIYCTVLVPVLSGFTLTAKIFKSTEIISIMFIALLGTLSYLFYYSAIKKLGPVRAMGLNISFAAWSALFTAIINRKIDMVLILCVLVIMTGSVISAQKKVQAN